MCQTEPAPRDGSDCMVSGEQLSTQFCHVVCLNDELGSSCRLYAYMDNDQYYLNSTPKI